jgi:hypothetical protein
MPENETSRSTITDSGQTGGRKAGRKPPNQPEPERVTVNLTAPSVRSMHNLTTWTGHSKTDIINRALQIYAFLQEILEKGGSLHVKQAPDAPSERLTFF